VVIVDVAVSEGVGASYCTDQLALQQSARDGLFIDGPAVLPGFRAPREVAEVVSIHLRLDDGSAASGDCHSVYYPGRAGVDPPVRAAELRPHVERLVAPVLAGAAVDGFRAMSQQVAAEVERRGGRIGSALRWGLGCALLNAVAASRRVSAAEVVAEEWQLPWAPAPLRLNGQHGLGWELGADKAILGRLAAYHRATHNRAMWDEHPAALRWLRDRVARFAPGHRLAVQLDLNGFPGRIFGDDRAGLVACLEELERAAAPLPLLLGSPFEMRTRDEQVRALAALRAELRGRGLASELIAEFWCASREDHLAFAEARAADYQMVHAPTIGDVAAVVQTVVDLKQRGVKVYLAGTATGTHASATVIAHLALATNPELVLATPGGGLTEAVSLATTEAGKVIALAARPHGTAGSRSASTVGTRGGRG
jgi:methylaspartate ammonia-lyase